MRVLIAEDYPDTLEALRMVFERAGWEVSTAKDGRDALRIYHDAIQHDDYFDLLVLDIQMPRLNGIAVGVNVRNLEKYGNLPRAIHIYLTGHDEELKIHGEELVAISFADAYVRKPADPIELVKMATKLVKVD